MTPSGQNVLKDVSGTRVRTFAIWLGVITMVAASALGLFVRDASVGIGAGVWSFSFSPLPIFGHWL